MEATQTAQPLNFETVWAALMENREQMKETDRQMKETDRQMKETGRYIKETDRIVRNNARLIGELGGRFGEMIEYMVLPNLLTKFRALGFVFTEAYPDAVIDDTENDIYAQIDITLKNGDKVMIVEVKSKPSTEDITDHIKRMEKVKAHAILHNDHRIFLGAIAGMVFKDNEKKFAMKNGFYVIEPSGETFKITAPRGDNSVREW